MLLLLERLDPSKRIRWNWFRPHRTFRPRFLGLLLLVLNPACRCVILQRESLCLPLLSSLSLSPLSLFLLALSLTLSPSSFTRSRIMRAAATVNLSVGPTGCQLFRYQHDKSLCSTGQSSIGRLSARRICPCHLPGVRYLVIRLTHIDNGAPGTCRRAAGSIPTLQVPRRSLALSFNGSVLLS